jgi:hypothetical protein
MYFRKFSRAVELKKKQLLEEKKLQQIKKIEEKTVAIVEVGGKKVRFLKEDYIQNEPQIKNKSRHYKK